MTDVIENSNLYGIAITDSEAECVTGAMSDDDNDIEERVRSSFNELKQAVGLMPVDTLIKPKIDEYMEKCEAAINVRNWYDIRSCCGMVYTLAHVTAADTAVYEQIQIHTFAIINLCSHFE